jgi:hypothetical protein
LQSPDHNAGRGSRPVPEESPPPELRERLIVYGDLNTLDDGEPAGGALAVQAPDRDAVVALLEDERTGVDVFQDVDIHDSAACGGPSQGKMPRCLGSHGEALLRLITRSRRSRSSSSALSLVVPAALFLVATGRHVAPSPLPASRAVDEQPCAAWAGAFTGAFERQRP